MDLITPLFKALGWDVENEAGLLHHARDVLVEKQGSADLLSKVRGFSRPHAQEPQTSEKRGLRYSLYLKPAFSS